VRARPGGSRFIATEIRRHADAGGRFNDVAIFYRINALSRNLEAALRTAQIPYQVARGVAFFQRKEIKDTLAYVRLVANPQDQVALLRIINTPARGIGDVTVQRLLNHAADTGRTPLEVLQAPEQIPDVGRAAIPLREFARLIQALSTAAGAGSIQELVEQATRSSGLVQLWSRSDDESAIENVNELITFASEYDRQHADGSGSLTDGCR